MAARRGHWEPIYAPPIWLLENSDGTLSMRSLVFPGCFVVLRNEDLLRIFEPRKRWVWDDAV